MVRLLISTGEVSGDLQGSLLIAALHEEARRRQLNLDVVALGGKRMEAAGAEVLVDTSGMGAIGLLEALPLVLPTLRLQARVRRWLREHPPDAVVLIDYIGANLNLGRQLRRRYPSLPISYYIAPQEWAWRMGEGGTTRLIGFTDRILAIFPQEARFYESHGARVTWVGHPLIDTLARLPDRLEARRSLGLPEQSPVLLLLPASRPQELRYLLPAMVEGVAELQRRRPDLEVLVPAGLDGFEPRLRAELDRVGLRGRVIAASDSDALKPELCAAADAALTKSGTVNLELALRGVPQVTGYRVSRATAFVARHLLRFNVPHISPVNLVLEERLVPELLQDAFDPSGIVAALDPLLDREAPARQAMLDGYRRLRERLGQPGVTRRAASAILDHLQQA